MKTRDFFSLDLPKSKPGDIVRAFRKNLGLTQADLAQITGIAESNISAIEAGRVAIGVERAAVFAAAFGLDPARLLFPNGPEDVLSRPELQAIRKRAAARIKARAKTA